MLIIKEFHIKKKSCYRVQDIINNQIIKDKVIDIEVYSKIIDGKKKTIIYHSDKTFNEDVYNYLNNEKYFYSENTRKKVESSLRVMTVWEEILEKDFTEFEWKDVQKFIFFLEGKSSIGSEIKMELISSKNAETVSVTLAHIKDLYRSAKGILGTSEITPFDELRIEKNYPKPRIYLGNEISDAIGTQMYREIPRYISPEEFQNLLDVVQTIPLPKKTKKNKEKIKKIKVTRLRDEIMLRLMFQGGLRIGEVLGLTMEDYELIENIHGVVLCRIIIRNRFSDKSFQYAKTLPKVNDRKRYRQEYYQEKDNGYQEVFIPEVETGELYKKLEEYINAYHEYARRKENNRYSETVADAVGKFKRSGKTNHYLFLNGQGGLLKYGTWNKHLREIFEKAGLKVDTDCRRNNLSHRLRHGFVMDLINNTNIQSETDFVSIMKRTRHKSIQSLYVYYNPTTSDIVNKKQEVENFILDGMDKERENNAEIEE